MFDPLHDAVRRQDVDDTEIIHRVERQVLLVRRAKAAFVLVKEEVLTVARVLLGQNAFADAFDVRVRVPVHGAPHDVGLLRGGRRRRCCAAPMQTAVRVRLWRHVDFGWRKDPERVAPDVVSVPTLHVVYTDQKRIIHHAKLLEKLGVAAELFREERTLLRAELEFLAAVDPIEVFEHRTRVLACALLGV